MGQQMAVSQIDGVIVIIDFGSQYTQLIVRRVRELQVFSEVVLPKDFAAYQVRHRVMGVILSGGPQSVVQQTKIQDHLACLWQQSVPVLGICYGMQLMAATFGGKVVASDQREYGAAVLSLPDASWLQLMQDDQETAVSVWMSHSDHVHRCPNDFKVMASTETIPVAAMMHVSKPWYAVQFHPEVDHTQGGAALLRHFVFESCQAQPNWAVADMLADITAQIEAQVQDGDQIILGLSGGVDSSVLALLLHRIVGHRLTCLLIDHGLLRANEAQLVMDALAHHEGLNVHVIDAKAYFFDQLKGIDAPEEKRKVIGHAFIAQFNAAATRLAPKAVWLAQGTIYPDVIESFSDENTKAIKSHHNVGGLPKELGFKLLEPLRSLFKDEVRLLGKTLGLHEAILNRHPFPGPGLAVRILGEISDEKVAILQQADAIYQRRLREAGHYDQLSQAFAVFLPIKSVGVLGDVRHYGYVIALRAVSTKDFMTAEVGPLPLDWLQSVANQIVNEVKAVSRVVYDLSSKPPATIEWE